VAHVRTEDYTAAWGMDGAREHVHGHGLMGVDRWHVLLPKFMRQQRAANKNSSPVHLFKFDHHLKIVRKMQGSQQDLFMSSFATTRQLILYFIEY
jgi:hypothetical protein